MIELDIICQSTQYHDIINTKLILNLLTLKTMLKKIIFVLLSSFAAIAPIYSKDHEPKENMPSKKASSYEVIKPASKEQVAEIMKEIEEKVDWDKIGDYIKSDISESEKWYIVDINNDGKLEYVSFVYDRYNCDLIIFSKNDNELKCIKNLCQESYLGCVNDKYRFDYFSPITNGDGPFVKVGGKTYIFARRNGFFDCHRVILYWKNNKYFEIASSYWIKQQRLLFKQLYDAKRYHDAYAFLSDFEARFRNKIDPRVDLWMQSEISLAALRCNKPHDALCYIKRIKESKAFTSAKPALIPAVNCNEKLANDAIKEDELTGTKGKYNYDWLLEFKEPSGITYYEGIPIQCTKNIACDERFDDLLTAALPSVQNNKHNSISYKDNLLDSSAYNFKAINDRFALFSGYWAYDRGYSGFFWCDLKDKVSIVATGEMRKSFNPCDGCCPEIQHIYLTSRSLLFNEIPKQFYKELAQWIKKEDLGCTKIVFDDRLGKRTEVDKKLLGIEL